MERLINTLDHVELVNWIHYMAYPSAKVNKTTINLDGREAILLPSGRKVRITIKVEELD